MKWVGYDKFAGLDCLTEAPLLPKDGGSSFKIAQKWWIWL